MVSLRFTGEVPIDVVSDPLDDTPKYFVRMDAEILLGSEYEDSATIGRLVATVVDLDRVVGARQNIRELADAHTSEVYELVSSLFDRRGVLKDKVDVEHRYVDVHPKLVHVDLIEIDPVYRKRGIGWAAIHAIATLATTRGGLLTLVPFPLEYSGKVTADNKREFIAAKRRLRRYYRRLGFSAVRGTRVMILMITDNMAEVLINEDGLELPLEDETSTEPGEASESPHRPAEHHAADLSNLKRHTWGE